MPTATVNNIEISYQLHGEGTPALYIHGGFGGEVTTLAPGTRSIVDALPPAGVQLITFDRRCAGESEYTSDDAFRLHDTLGPQLHEGVPSADSTSSTAPTTASTTTRRPKR